MKARYVRVSTASQNLERQLIKKHPDETLYIDVVSGTIPFAKRDKGKELINEVANETVSYITVSSIDRLGRNLKDILTTLEILNDNQVILKVENLGLESLVNGKPNSAFKLIISVMANIAEMERENLRERQEQGIAIAKANGTYRGRVRGSKVSNDDILYKYKDVVKHIRKKKPLRDISKLTSTSLATVQKVKRILAEEQTLDKAV